MVGPERPLFVLFGSSIVQSSFNHGGWGATLQNIYARKADILLRGYNGWNSRRALEVIDKVFPKDSPVQPSLVIVYFGGNDSVRSHPSGLGPHVPLPEYIENMRSIASHLKASCSSNDQNITSGYGNKSLSDKTRTLFLSCPPMNEEMFRQFLRSTTGSNELNRTNEGCRIYSEACIDLCQQIGVKVIDLWNAMQKPENWATTCFTDGVHLSSVGSKIVAKEILKVIGEAEWEPSLCWKSLPTEFAEASPHYPVAADGISTTNCSEPTIREWELLLNS